MGGVPAGLKNLQDPGGPDGCVVRDVDVSISFGGGGQILDPTN